MKINMLYYILFIQSISTFTNAQEQLVNTTTIQKIGEMELKVSVNQPKLLKFYQNENLQNYKRQWKKNTNGTTEIEFNKDVTVNNIKIKSGKYLLLLFPGNDWKPANDVVYAFPGNDWKPKDSITKFPGNDWNHKKDSLNTFPGNDWKPKKNTINTFPGNDWNPKNSQVKFPGNDWKPKESKIRFPGNDWKPVNDLMESFPGNDWLIVFYQNTESNSKKLDKNLIAAEIIVSSKRTITPSTNVSANFIYLNINSVQLELSWDKTLLSIPINIR